MKNFYTNWFQAHPEDAIRQHKEFSQKYRNGFQKDRDRILYSKSFRRLSGKTQVFLAGGNDHLRTRLTHSLEVNQIAKTIGSALNLNLDLIEAIALGHDIGHTPFGHIGERTLNFIMNGCEVIHNYNTDIPDDGKGFKHNLQALRVLSYLERNNEDYEGLNMSDFTLWGILNHTKHEPYKCKRNVYEKHKEDKDIHCYYNHINSECKQSGILCLEYYDKYKVLFNEKTSWTIEGLIVRIADEIAQRHHDIEDAIYANLINKDEILVAIESNFLSFFDKQTKINFEKTKSVKGKELLTAYLSRLVISFLVTKAIEDIKENLRSIYVKYSFKNSNDFTKLKKVIFKNEDIFTIINYKADFTLEENKFHDFLKNKILDSYVAQKMDGKAEYIIKKLFEAFINNPQQMPDRTILFFFSNFLGSDYLKQYNENNRIGQLRSELKDNFNRNPTPYYKWALLRTICDYISGMTDNFAYNQYEILYGSTRIFQS